MVIILKSTWFKQSRNYESLIINVSVQMVWVENYDCQLINVSLEGIFTLLRHILLSEEVCMHQQTRKLCRWQPRWWYGHPCQSGFWVRCWTKRDTPGPPCWGLGMRLTSSPCKNSTQKPGTGEVMAQKLATCHIKKN